MSGGYRKNGVQREIQRDISHQFTLEEQAKAKRELQEARKHAVRMGLANIDTTDQIRAQLEKKIPRDNSAYKLKQVHNPDDDPRETSRQMFGGQYRTGGVIDPKEILKQEMFYSDIKGADSHFEKSRPNNILYGVADRYILLDSALKSIGGSNLSRGIFQFQFMTQGVSRFQDQTIGISDKIENVTEIEISPFYIPTPLDNPYILNNGNNTGLPVLTSNGGQPPAGTLSQTPYENKVTIEIQELGRQFISDDLNVRHHLEFYSTINNNGTTLLTPDDNFSKFIFTDPVNSIQGMTIIFRNPYNNISFLPDVFTTPDLSVVVGAGQLLTFQFNNHGLNVNNLIFIRGFNSGNATLDTYVNSTAGLAVGVGGLTANQFRLNPDVDTTPLGLAVGATISAGGFSIIIAYRRIRIPMRIRCAVSRLTNYITP